MFLKVLNKLLIFCKQFMNGVYSVLIKCGVRRTNSKEKRFILSLLLYIFIATCHKEQVRR